MRPSFEARKCAHLRMTAGWGPYQTPTSLRPRLSSAPRCEVRRAALRPGHESIRREAIHQAVTAGAFEIGLRAAAVGPARGMRRVPGFRGVVVAKANAVGMSDHRRTLRAARPVLAGAVVGARERRAVRLRSRQHVMAVRRIAAAIDDVALFAERSLLGEVVG